MFPGSVGRAILSSVLVLLGSSSGLVAVAQSKEAARNSIAAPRITQEVDDTNLARIAGNIPLLARPEFDQGEAGRSARLTHVRLVLTRSKEQEADLETIPA